MIIPQLYSSCRLPGVDCSCSISPCSPLIANSPKLNNISCSSGQLLMKARTLSAFYAQVPYCSLNYPRVWMREKRDSKSKQNIQIIEVDGAEHRDMLIHEFVLYSVAVLASNFTCQSSQDVIQSSPTSSVDMSGRDIPSDFMMDRGDFSFKNQSFGC